MEIPVVEPQEKAAPQTLTPVIVGIHLYKDEISKPDSSKDEKIMVDREPFWVRRNTEEAVWECMQNHKHSQDPPCFTVIFQNDVFQRSRKFSSDSNGKAHSGPAHKLSANDTLYKYTVHVDGCDDLDPQGGVTP
jgi:hypothetical protein